MRVAWTRKAQQRVQEIYDRIALDQPGNATSFVQRLIKKAELIASTPKAGFVVAKYGRADLRETYEGEYRIIYRVHARGIDVVTVRHMARLLPKHIERL